MTGYIYGGLYVKISDEYLEAYARYKEETVLLSLTEPEVHDRLVSAVGDMLIALNDINEG
jgi:hypothetical protein